MHSSIANLSPEESFEACLCDKCNRPTPLSQLTQVDNPPSSGEPVESGGYCTTCTRHLIEVGSTVGIE